MTSMALTARGINTYTAIFSSWEHFKTAYIFSKSLEHSIFTPKTVVAAKLVIELEEDRKKNYKTRMFLSFGL